MHNSLQTAVLELRKPWCWYLDHRQLTVTTYVTVVYIPVLGQFSHTETLLYKDGLVIGLNKVVERKSR
jgi:hypothetical protein